MNKETIKAKVISTVRSDPFLTIDEIAAKVETTPRYVRTILSEAQLSLLQLRKEYAKQMERQLHPNHKPKVDERQYKPGLEIAKTTNAKIAKLLKLAPETELLQVSRMEKRNHVLIYTELITCGELRMSATEVPLRELLSVADPQLNLTQRQSWVEVVTSEKNLSKLLVGDESQPLLKISFLLFKDESPIAVETQWLPAEGIVLRDNTGSLEIAE